MTEAEEFYKIYSLDVVAIPTNKPMIREDLAGSDLQDRSRRSTGRWSTRSANCITKGQPVLVGTVAIENSEMLRNC